MITQARLKEVLTYNPETGCFSWIRWMNGFVKAARIAGYMQNGYIRIRIDKKTYQAHRLAWLYVHGDFPKNQIDHRNRNKADNSILNLRDVTQLVNSKNCGKNSKNTSGKVGVTWRKDLNKWQSRIMIEGRSKSLGYFAAIDDAINARVMAEAEYGFINQE